MISFTESAYELENIKKLQNLGYRYFSQEEILLKRRKNSEVLLLDELEAGIFRLNPGIEQDNVFKVIQKIKSLKGSSFDVANRDFHKYLTDGVKIHDSKQDKTVTYKIIDGINDDWIITNQFLMSSNHPQYNKQLPDMVAFCNGIPLVVFELKRMSDQDNLESAYNQMQNYQLYLSDLFIYNAFNVIANVSEVKFGTITSPLSRYQYWRGFNFEDGVDKLFSDLLSPDKIFDVITNYTFFTSEDNPKKIISSYHQYYGVSLSKDNLISILKDEDKEGNGKGGIFWHTQGSGKSFSMLFLVKNISKTVPGTTFIIVTDRNDLDNQLYKTFNDAKDFIGQKIKQFNSIKEIPEELKGRKQDGVYFTTVQKFNENIGMLSSRDNILVITDEAHRSHNNINKKFEFDNEAREIIEKRGNARYLREAFPRATFIGFTGTPIKKDDKSTMEIFGDVITQYLMSDAERDGVVVPIRYESRKPELFLDPEQLEILNEEYTDALDGIEDRTKIIGEVQKKINKSVSKIKNFIQDPDRIEGIAKDFISHYTTRRDYVVGKTMFVAFNRHIAFEYYKKIIELKPELEKNIKLIITNSNGQSDSPEMIEAAGTSEYRRRMAEEFKKIDSDFKIAIVVDMWLTGFDVPSLDSIYIDKPIKMHNLMQTIARTNRVYTNKAKNLNKEHGLVVDYVGLWKQLNEALSFYSGKSLDATRDERNVKNLKSSYTEKVNELYKQFDLLAYIKNISVNGNKTEWVEVLEKMTQKIIKDKMQQNFINATKKVSKWTNEILSIVNEEEIFPFQLLTLTRSNIINIELGNIDFRDIEKSLLDRMTKVIKFNKTYVVNEVEGDGILLSKIIEFIQKKQREGLEDLDLAEKVSGTRKLIDYTKKINFRRSEELASKLNELLKKYDNGYVTMDELIEGIRYIADEVKQMTSNELDEQGYTKEELAFYSIISDPINNSQLSKETLDKIFSELLEIINSNDEVISSWRYNDQAKMSVRKSLKEILLLNGYPPEEMEITANDIVDQIMWQKGLKGK